MSNGLWALAGVIVGTLSSGIVSIILQKRQFTHEKEMHFLENRGAENVKELLLEMLNHPNYTDRSFNAIRKKVGGYNDKELRQFLHEIDAKKTSRNEGKEEWWYLNSRSEERLEKRKNN